MKLHLLLFFLLIIPAISFSQEKIIKGKVVNYNTKELLANIKFKIKGADTVVCANDKGFFEIMVPDSLNDIKFDNFGYYVLKKIDTTNSKMLVLYLEPEESKIFDLNLEQLMNLTVQTPSIKKEKYMLAPSNIKVIKGRDIEYSGYRTLTDILQDVPGFDFLTYNDGGGEYPCFSKNRGIGGVGNENILVMVDGIVQNNISYNWSSLWTYENPLLDISKIEIIEGPGSAMYGAQAFSGVINIITKSNFDGIKIKPFYGSNFTRGIDLYYGKAFNTDYSLSLIIHKYLSNGDMGNRYDPGKYFHNLVYPDTILMDYDANGNFVRNIANPLGGQPIPAGFNTKINASSFRLKAKMKNSEIGLFFWDKVQGNGSYITAYEYNATDSSFENHFRNLFIYFKNKQKFSDKINLESNIVISSTNILPNTGFKYLYKFPGYIKNYVSYSKRSYIEERLYFNPNIKQNLIWGIKGTLNDKMPRMISLGAYPGLSNISPSSWYIANAGGGLGVQQVYPVYFSRELASYVLLNSQWTNVFHSSLGIRYDFSSEYGQILNPRLALIFYKNSLFAAKYLFGTAFRQPSIYELHDEFRGNNLLKPERIATNEIETDSRFLDKRLFVKTNLYYSIIKNFIGKVTDSLMPSGEKFENITGFNTAGVSIDATFDINKHISLYSNYMFMLAKYPNTTEWVQIDRTAKNKFNAGVTLNFIKGKLEINCRYNYVGKRKAPESNLWLQKYHNGYAPAYNKFNLAVNYKFLKNFHIQLSVFNLFNEKYYGIGRERGESFAEEYDYRNNINPEGFSPPYHPQPGREMYISLSYSF